jgi:hypothetical protein
MKGTTTTVKKVSYQTGVDVLGFPIYQEHTIIKGETQSKFSSKLKEWVNVEQKLIKQH